MERTNRQFWLGATCVVILALILRIIFLLGTEVQTHIAGDINDYVHYAWNLGQHGVYSSAPIDPSAAPEPDSFRPPGYPLFLLVAMWLGGFGPGWLAWAYALQILVSAATVLLTMMMGREWMKPAPALAAGALLALWPHHVVFSATLLSETLTGFAVLLALWLTAVAQRRRSISYAAAAGVAFGLAALVNTMLVLLPLLIAALLVGARLRRAALALLVAFAVLPAFWWTMAPRDASGRSSVDRAAINLVQGAWPQYHKAWQTRDRSETSRAILAAIDDEISAIDANPASGLLALGGRLAEQPAATLKWYALEKPWLLWDWNIRLGWYGIHFLPTDSSPFERYPVLQVVHATLKTLNPVVFVLAMVTAIVLGTHWVRGRQAPLAAVATAGCMLYVTFFHALLQAEPRYSIPYRPEQLLMATFATSWLLITFIGVRRKAPKSDAIRQDDTQSPSNPQDIG